tara:strand:- start:63 stop:980 length:918 start_codon:yes stop_codon:yes gene_type:complete
MSNSTIKRILKEKIKYHKNPLDKEGIFINYDDNDIFKARVLILGPEDTPYAHGFYLFLFTFPENYPHSPPKCLFLTTKGQSRMNPNLYSNGHVCLSILNTWNGPGWTSCQTLASVCISIQGLVLHSKPIQNEPVFQNETGLRLEKYNRILVHENLRIGVLNMIMHPPSGFQIFQEIMDNHFQKHFNDYVDVIHRNLHMDGKIDHAPVAVWPMTIKYKYADLLKVFIALAKQYGFFEDTELYISLIDTEQNQILPPPKKYKGRRVPNGKATQYDVGFTRDSENDGYTYIIKLDKAGRKRWRKVIVI